MTDPTERQAAALALPGDDWPQAIARARRLLTCVVEVEKWQVEGCFGWIERDHPGAYCIACSMHDLGNYDPRTGREYETLYHD